MSLFPSAVDRLFARFCRSGDAAALGEVFDRTAPELLRVACFLVGQRADAEDVVQRTFLAAIEARGTFRRGARALPWLLGILANHARQLQRERRRVPPPADERTVDPALEAAQRELRDRLVALRNELGEPYTEVVQLHLEQGLNAKEIAARLQRPAGTVRTQLMRALTLLRQRLPDGVVAGGAFALLGRPSTAAGPALAAIRRSIVHAAGGAPAKAAAVAPLAAIGSLFVTKKLVAVVPLLLGLSLLGAWLAWPDGASLAGGAPPLAAAPASASLATTSPAAPAANGAANADAPARLAADGEALAEPGFAALRVRVRLDGAPLAGVGVFASNGRTVARRDAVTDAAGVAELPHITPGAWRVSTTLGTGGSDSDNPVRCTLAGGEVKELEITVARAAEAHGRVVDESDRPVANARIWMSIEGDYSVGHEVVHSGADGSFRVPILGAHFLGARKAGYEPSHTICAMPTKVAEPIVLKLARRGGLVRGTVRDAAGAPIAGAKVSCGTEFEFAAQSAATDAAGAYLLEDLSPGEQQCVATRGGARTTATLALAAAATAAWHPVLGANLPLAGRIVGADGNGLARMFVEAWTDAGERGHATTGDDGRFLLPEAGTEPVDLCVSLDMQVLRNERGVKPGRDDVVITLTAQDLPSAFVTGRVVDERGQPVATVLVPWHADSGRALHHHSDAKTGAFRIGPLRPGSYKLVAESPTHGRAELGQFELAPGATHDLATCTLKAPGGVRFTVTMEGRPAPGGLLFLRRPDGSWNDTLVIERGVAQHDALPPGPVYVTAEFQSFSANLEIAIVAGAVAQATLDMQRTNRATVTLRDPRGRPRDELGPLLHATHPDGSFAGLFGMVNLPGSPQFFAEMPPGRYQLRVTTNDGRTATGEVDLRAGHAELTIELPR